LRTSLKSGTIADMEKITLKVEKRTLTGSKVKQLRRQRVIPANVFGKGVESLSIQVPSVDLNKAFKEAGETSLVWLKVTSEDIDRPTLIKNIHYNPVTGDKLHVDFHQVNLKEKVLANVPVEITGESEMVNSNLATISQSLYEIEVEALPTDIPENITFDISILKEIGDQLKVSDAKVSKEVEIKTDSEQVVISLQEPQKEEEPLVTEEEVSEDATGAEAPVEAEATETEKSTEGETPQQ